MKKILLSLLLVTLATPARAAEPDKNLGALLGELDADPAAVAVAKLGSLKALHDLLVSFEGPLHGDAGRMAKELEPFASEEAWASVGLDPAVPIVAAVHLVGAGQLAKLAAAGTSDDALKLGANLSIFMHLRVVAHARDQAKLEAAIASFAKKEKKLGVAYSLIVPEGQWLFRFKKGVVIADLILPVGPTNFAKESRRIEQTVLASVHGNGAAGVLARGAGVVLGSQDVGIWIEPSRTLELGTFTGWVKILQAIPTVPQKEVEPLFKTGQGEVSSCKAIADSLAAGSFADLAMLATIKPGAFDFQVSLGVRDAAVVNEAFATTDDALVDLGVGARAVGVGVLNLRSLGGLGKLPHVGVLGKGLDAMSGSLRMCGPAGTLGILSAWPTVLYIGLEGMVGKEVLGALRNVAFAFQSMDWKTGATGVVIASADASGKEALDAAVTKAAGTGKLKPESFGARKVDSWPTGRSTSPFRLPLADGVVGYGLAIVGGHDALAWFFGSPSPRGSSGAPSAIGMLHFDLAKVFEQFAKNGGLARPYFEELSRRLGHLRGTLTLDGGLLTTALHVDLK